MLSPGDVVIVDFPGVTGIKRRPAVVLSSPAYHSTRPDVIVGVLTTSIFELTTFDCQIVDWASANLRVPSCFRSFLVTLPPSSNLSYAGRLSESDWRNVTKCVKNALEQSPGEV